MIFPSKDIYSFCKHILYDYSIPIKKKKKCKPAVNLGGGQRMKFQFGLVRVVYGPKKNVLAIFF